jgi:peptidoglycan/LPS O-acetylase OafA/YrhL
MLQKGASRYVEYYSEVDGLRALAVTTVILFHLNIAGFTGGFVGVDVFFVISGYLITKLIVAELSRSDGTFDYSRFFFRRAKRIYPALLVTLFISFWIAVVVFNAQDLKRFSGSVISALSAVSNIFFWQHAGYFDVGNDLKPALHTWSLSVEFQFYLIWPFIVLWSFRSFSRFGQLICVLSIGAASFALNYVMIDTFNMATSLSKYLPNAFKDREATIFFLMPFRVFEFSIGASLLWLEACGRRFRWSHELCTVFGCAMILYAAIQFDVGLTYPSYHALVPCLGSALILMSARSARFAGAFFRNPVSVGLGAISYSLYLVHWPIIVFYKHVYPGHWTTSDKVAICGFSLLLAMALYWLVEKPFRSISVSSLKGRSYGFWAGPASVLAVVVMPAVYAYGDEGWQWRYPVVVADLFRQTGDSLKHHKIRSPGCEFTNFRDFDAPKCVYPQPGKINILLLGDSVASYVWIGLRDNLPEDRYNILQLTPSNCRPGINWGVDYCLQSNQFIFDFIAKNEIDLTILSSLGPDHSNLRKSLAYLASVNRRALVIGQPFVFNGRLVDIVAAAAGAATTQEHVQEAARNGLIDTGEARREIRRIAMEQRAGYFDIQEQLCKIADDLTTCNFVIDNGLITADNNHLTPSAAIKIFKGLAVKIMSEYP